MQNERVLIWRGRDSDGRQIQHVHVTEEATPDDCFEILDLENVTSLVIERAVLTDEAFAALCQFQMIEKLKIVEMQGVTDVGAASFIRFQSLQQYFSHGWHREPVSYALGQMHYLERCSINNSKLTDDDVQPLCESPRLRDLGVERNEIQGTAFELFSASEELTSISLSQNLLTEEGLKCLTAVPNLQSLAIGWCPIEGDWLIPLRELSQLKRLILASPDYRASHFHALRQCRQLESLLVSYESLDADGIDALTNLKQLRELFICGETPEEIPKRMQEAFRKKGVRCAVNP